MRKNSCWNFFLLIWHAVSGIVYIQNLVHREYIIEKGFYFSNESLRYFPNGAINNKMGISKMKNLHGISGYAGKIFILFLISFLSFQCGHNSSITAPPENNDEQTVTPEPAYIIPLPVSDSATGRIFNLTSSCNIYLGHGRLLQE